MSCYSGVCVDASGTASGGAGGSTAGQAGSVGSTGGTTETSTGGTGGAANTGGTDEATGGSDAATGGTDAATGGTDAATGGSDVSTGGTTEEREPVTVGDSGLIPSDGGNFVWDWDVSGVIGPWFTYDDGEGSDISSLYESPITAGAIGSSAGRLCFEGTTAGHDDTYYETIWGAGAGLALCHFPDDMS